MPSWVFLKLAGRGNHDAGRLRMPFMTHITRTLLPRMRPTVSLLLCLLSAVSDDQGCDPSRNTP
jgi:hypothetical protein